MSIQRSNGWSRFAFVGFLHAVSISSCVDANTPTSLDTQHVSRAAEQVGFATHTARATATRAIDIQLTANGAFRPGEPIALTLSARSRIDAPDVSLSLSLLDSEPAGGIATARIPRALGSYRGALQNSARRDVHASIAFQRPGYYRVLAQAKVNERPHAVTEKRDTLRILTSYETLWLLIDESGGRITSGYDISVLDGGRVPLYGSYGPFLDRRRPDRPNPLPRADSALPSRTLLVPATTDVGARNGGAALSVAGSGAVLTAQVKYGDYDSGAPPNFVPVPGAEVEAICYGKSSPTVITYDIWHEVWTSTNSSGYLTVICDPGYEYIEGYVRLRGTYAYATGEYNAASGVFFGGYDDEFYNLTVANDFAARVFLDLTERIPAVFTAFGRSRGRQSAEVSADDSNWGIYYCVAGSGQDCHTADQILTNYTRVFGEDGVFVTVHEFGHAFHWTTVESPSNYSCDGESHGFFEEETLSCVFVEGFADFLSMWIVGDRLVNQPYGGDWGLENNLAYTDSAFATNPVPATDGLRVEGSFASFLYDLVDDGSEPDSYTNTTGTDDDQFNVPASWLVDVIEHCELNALPLQMNGPDQMVYCLEESVSARAVASGYYSPTAWRSYLSVSWDEPLTAYDSVAIREAWKFNMYGQ